MPPRVFQPLVEVFLLVDQPRQRLSHWTRALAPLDDASAPPVATVDAYYDPTTNQAIFGLRYDELALGAERLRVVVELAVLVEIGMIQPAELSDGDRRRFVTERLARCTVHVGGQRTVVDALIELVRRLRALKITSAQSEMTPPTIQRYRPTEPVARARSETSDPRPQLAKGTRKVGDSPEPLVPLATRDFPAGPRDPEAFEPAVTMGRRPPSSPPNGEPRRPSPNVVTRAGVHRANTVTMSSTETQRILEASLSSTADLMNTQPLFEPEARPPEPPRPAGTIPPGVVRAPAVTRDAESINGSLARDVVLPPSEPPRAQEIIHARYLRGGRWLPVRIGSLSLRGAALMAVALPRLDDRVEVALAYTSHRALVRGTVTKVSTMDEAASSGTTTFTVTFELDDTARKQLTALLIAARAANVTIKPPPPRSTRRYPVEWPVCLGTTRGAIRAEALDVSAGGMFVKPLHPLVLDANLSFSAVLDDGLAPVSGRSRVVRNITDADAQAAGLSPGYGLSIVEMPEQDRERWWSFLTRIERRAGRRVLIAAGSARLVELQGGLVAAGYAVTGGSEPGAIAELASADAHPIDAALLDATWLATAGTPSGVEALLSARNVPCVTAHGDARRARIAIDKLLSVA